MPNVHDTLLGLIGTLYAAPGGTSGWMAFLQELKQATDGAAAHFIAVTTDPGADPRGNISITTVDSHEALADYQTHWGQFDPWGQCTRLHEAPAQTVVLGDEVVPHAAFTRTPFYDGFASRYDFCRVAFGIVERHRHGVSVVSLNRSERQSSFDRHAGRLLQALMPHVRRGLQLHSRLLAADALATDLSGLIAATPDAVVLVTAHGRVTMMNDAARRLVTSRDGMGIDDGELRASAREAQPALRAAIADAARTTSGDGFGSGGAVLLRRRSGRRPLMAVVSPTSRPTLRDGLPDAREASAMVVIRDPESTPMLSDDVMHALYRLTPAEARLVRLLVRGVSLRAAARQFDVSLETVRTRLKRVFQKTATSGQSELVAVVLKIAGQQLSR